MNQFKKTINIILVITLLMSYLVTPTYFVFANTCTGYKVSVLKSDGTTTDLSCHTSYSDAKNAMLNYNSDENSVAVIYNNSGNIINAKYAIAKFVPNKTINLYPTSALKTAATYTATSYGSDVAFIDYDATYNSAKIKISGYTGWVSLEYLTIVPINQLVTTQIRINVSSINIRPTPSTALPKIGDVFNGDRYQYYEKKVAEGYTWYKIKYKSQYGWVASTSNWTSEMVETGLQTYYEVNANGELVHYFEQNFSGKISTASNVLGTAPNYLTKLTKYYSFDGNYFYTDIKSMINDYRNNIFASAINSNIPHYNYYQYLPHRTKSSITSDDIASYLSSYTAKPIKEEYINPLGYVDNKLVRYDCDGKTVLAYLEKDNGETPDKDIIKFCKDLEGNLSVLYGEGPNFINSGNTYGINSSSALALAIHESGWGRSLIAVAKNNVFGHSAYDSNPVGSAAGYPSVKYGIDYHTRDYVSKGYANPTDYRYYGSHFGNKGSGMNVKYASDPYWGEKVAKHYYNLDKSVGLQDHNMYEIGLKRTSAVVNIRKEPTTASTSLYTLDANDTNIPMVILGEVTGEKIDGSTKWYKIQTDPVLNSTRDATLPKAEIGEYNWDTNYAYIHSSLVHISDEEEYYEKKEGMFHFEKLEWNNTTQTIDFRGYLAVKGVNNTLSIPASYNLILQDVNTNEEHIIVLDRWTNTKEHPFIVPSEDGYNYSGSWFKSNIDLSNVPEGDYTVYVRARTNRVEAKIKLRNFFSKTMTRKITDNNGRGYLFRTNY
ncbi:MAG: glucosaminidase domain-containing protein, partial [Bacilli bacterium]|nr:glucosaminidase domain-containing protein [Bacilli bacterium]